MKKRRGFALLSPQRLHTITSRGGKAAHEKGTAHEWTRVEAQEAGRLGGLKRNRKIIL